MGSSISELLALPAAKKAAAHSGPQARRSQLHESSGWPELPMHEPKNSVQFVAGWGGVTPTSHGQVEPAPPVTPSDSLLAFFRSEFMSDERSGFTRLKRVPDSGVEARLAWYQSLSAADKASFVDCVAHYAHSRYGFLIGAPEIDCRKHPFFSQWSDVNVTFPFRSNRDVMLLRDAVRQYKIDRRRGVQSCVSEDLFRFAESVKSIKAPELRKRVRAVLNKFSFRKTHDSGGHRCIWAGQEFEVNVDFHSRHAQLRRCA
jgi:hypothetical protein